LRWRRIWIRLLILCLFQGPCCKRVGPSCNFRFLLDLVVTCTSPLE
jgi:hypothetical protein